MKFKDWEDFVDEINEYGRHGYIKKKTFYDPFNKVNKMVMQHKVTQDTMEFVLYPDDELYDLDRKNEPYVKPKTKSELFLENLPKKNYGEKIDHRTKEHRSDKYPSKPGMRKEDVQEQTTPNPKNPPKPGPYRKKGNKK